MAFYQLAFRYLKRKKSKTILLFFVLLIASSMILSTNMILRATADSKAAIGEKTKAKVVMGILKEENKITLDDVEWIKGLAPSLLAVCFHFQIKRYRQSPVKPVFHWHFPILSSRLILIGWHPPDKSLLALTLLAGTTVVSLLLCMWMRTRQREAAIFISIGKSKSSIFLQVFLESFLVSSHARQKKQADNQYYKKQQYAFDWFAYDRTPRHLKTVHCLSLHF